ncbi:MAG: 50S ribosomal protein L18 [Candidatus Levybacteria bacterium]|nr:50S ribosomal protein L18 [Candidatus Levybacteria bacterium]
MNTKRDRIITRQERIRRHIRAVSSYPRLSVFRSNNLMYAQIIDDKAQKTLIGMSEDKKNKGTKIERARGLGQTIAKLAIDKKIKQVVFDKGSYAYHGRVKALAEGAREGGLVF